MIDIRKYKETDWQRLCDIHDAARKDELRNSVDMKAFKTLEQTAENEGLFEAEVLVADYQGELSGFIAFNKNEITWLYVEPKHYQKGIGSALLNAALNNCGEWVQVEVLHKNESAILFYKKHGFEIIEKKDGVLEGNEQYKTAGYLMKFDNRNTLKKQGNNHSLKTQ